MNSSRPPLLIAALILLTLRASPGLAVPPDYIAISKAIPKVGDEVTVRVTVAAEQRGENESGKLPMRVIGPEREETFARESPLFDNPMGAAEAVFSWTPGRNGWHTLEIELPNGDSGGFDVPVVERDVHFGWYGPTAGEEVPRFVTMAMNVKDAEREYWLRRGVIPAAWKGGYCYPEWTREQFLESWSNPRWVAIDEFGGAPEVQEKLRWALKELRRRHPDHFVALWLAGAGLQRDLRDAVDLFMPEIYLNYHGNHLGRLTGVVERARQEGLFDKTIIGLGTNDRAHGAPTDPTRELILRQLQHLKRIAPDLLGLAFFNAYGCPPGLLEYTDGLCYDYFVGPVVTLDPSGMRAEARRFAPGNEVRLSLTVRNIGNMDVHGGDVRIRLLDQDGNRLATAGVEELQVGEEREVEFEMPMPSDVRVLKAQVAGSNRHTVLDGSAEAVLANAAWPKLESDRRLMVAVPPLMLEMDGGRGRAGLPSPGGRGAGGEARIVELSLDGLGEPDASNPLIMEHVLDGGPPTDVASEVVGQMLHWAVAGDATSWRFFGVYFGGDSSASPPATLVTRSADGPIVARNDSVQMILDPSSDAVTDLRLTGDEQNLLASSWAISCPGYEGFGEPTVHEGSLYTTITIPFRSDLAQGESIYRFPRMGAAVEITRRFNPLEPVEMDRVREGAGFEQRGGSYALQAGVGALVQRGELLDTQDYRDLLFGYLGGGPAEGNSRLCGWFDFSPPEGVGGGLGVAVRERWRDSASRTYDVTRYYDAGDWIDLFYVFDCPTLIEREQTSTIYLVPHGPRDLLDESVTPPAQAVWEAFRTPVIRCNDGRLERR